MGDQEVMTAIEKYKAMPERARELIEELGKFEIATMAAKLEAENRRLRDALTKIHDLCDEYWGELSGGIWTIPDDDYHAWYCRDLAYEALQGERARKALGSGEYK